MLACSGVNEAAVKGSAPAPPATPWPSWAPPWAACGMPDTGGLLPSPQLAPELDPRPELSPEPAPVKGSPLAPWDLLTGVGGTPLGPLVLLTGVWGPLA